MYVLLAGCLACSVNRSGLGEGDGGVSPAADAGSASDDVTMTPTRDAGARVDAGVMDAVDAGGLDPADAGVMDMVDTGIMDPADAGGLDPDDAGQPSCESIFASAPSHLICNETPTECELSVLLSGRTCNDLCGDFDRACIRGYGGAVGSCTREGDGVCDGVRTDHICVCTRAP